MPDPKPTIFRKESLERLASPERLDQLMLVVRPQDWLGLGVIGGFILFGLGWSIFGRIPITLNGRGVLVAPRRVVDLQSTGIGRLAELRVKVGDTVRQGQVLGRISQSDLQEQLRLQQAKRAELERQNTQLAGLTNQQVEAQLVAIRQQRQTVRQRLSTAEALATLTRDRDLTATRQQRRSLSQQLQDKRDLDPILLTRLENRKQLQSQGAIAADSVLEAETAYRDNRSQIVELQSQLEELRLRELASDRTYRDALAQISEYRAQLVQLDSQAKTLAQQTAEASSNRRNQIQEVERQISQLSLTLQNNSEIRSPYDGQILELTVAPGQVLSPGLRLGSIETAIPNQQLISIAYFPIKDGKQIRPGMTLQITPDTVKREEFGGILSQVSQISAFPVSEDNITRTIGNAELAKGLAIAGGQIEVQATLKPDPSTPTGYGWSSSTGPTLPLTPGTPTTVRVTLEQRAPITFLLPILRSVTGLN